MKLEFLLVLFLICLLQGSQVLGRHLKRKDELRANREVRSIVSAIVDAILDGDRKKRSEDVDYSEDEDRNASETLRSKAKRNEEYGNENRTVRSPKIIGRTFTKREDRDSEDSEHLANVIATSDVNATDDQLQTRKRDIIKQEVNGTSKESQDKNRKIDDDSDSGKYFKLPGSGSGFSEVKSDDARVRSAPEHRSASPDSESKKTDSLGFVSTNDGAKEDAESAERKDGSGSPYFESESGSGEKQTESEDSEQESDYDDDMGSGSESGSGSGVNDDVESGTWDEDSENTTSGEVMGERVLENRDNTSDRNSPNNFTEIVIDTGDYENTSQQMDKDYVSGGNHEGGQNENTEFAKNETNLNFDEDTDNITKEMPFNSSVQVKEQFVLEERNTGKSKQVGKSKLASNQSTVNYPVFNTSVDDDEQGGATEITPNEAFAKSSESNKQLASDEKQHGNDEPPGNIDMMRVQDLVDSIEAGDGESNAMVLEQNGGDSRGNGGLNSQRNSQWQREAGDKNLGKNNSGKTDAMFDEFSRKSGSLPNGGETQVANGGVPPESKVGSIYVDKDKSDLDKQFGNRENSMALKNTTFGMGQIELVKKYENRENIADPERGNFGKDQVGSKKQTLEKSSNPELTNFENNRVIPKKQSQFLGNSAGPENRYFVKNEVGFEKESGIPGSDKLSGHTNFVDEEMIFKRRFGNLGNNEGLENRNTDHGQKDFEKQSGSKNSEGLETTEGKPLAGGNTLDQEQAETLAEGSIAEDSKERGEYKDQITGANNGYDVGNGNRYPDRNVQADNKELLDKRNIIPGVIGHPNLPKAVKEDALDDLVSGVGEPWIKDFLTKTLEMAVNGDKAIKTPTRDGAKDSEETDTKPLQLDNVEELDFQTANKRMVKHDDMPTDATKSRDRYEDGKPDGKEDDYGDDDANHDDKDNDYKDGDEPEDEISKTEKQPSLPVLNKENRADEYIFNNNMKEVPPPQPTEMNKILKYTNQTPIPASKVVPALRLVPLQPMASALRIVPAAPAPQLPVAPLLPAAPRLSAALRLPATPQLPIASQLPHKPLVAVSQEHRVQTVVNVAQPAGNTVPGKQGSLASIPKTDPVLPDGQLKGMDTKQEGNVAELNNVINNEIQNVGTTYSREKLESDFKEAQLFQVLKDAIPVDRRRPKDIDNDIKQEIEDLKDYASALTDTAGMSPAQHDDLAKKLASDLLDEMKVADERKEELLKKLMAFVTAVQVATIRERLSEIRAQVLSFASKQSNDPTRIQGEAIRLLEEFSENLPPPKDQLQKKERGLLKSKMAISLVKEAERRSLRRKLKKALSDLVADKLL